MKYISTTVLANKLHVAPYDMFCYLETLGWVEKKGNNWQLTENGKKWGGCLKDTKEKQQYIAWPVKKTIEKLFRTNPVTSTGIKKAFHNITRNRINLVLSELGWIEKDFIEGRFSGWTVTSLGKTIGGKTGYYKTHGTSYVLWPEIILKNQILIEALKNIIITKENQIQHKPVASNLSEPVVLTSSDEFRNQFPANIRTKDGHYVRSRGELIIDNALYDYGLPHAYEKKLPVEEEIYTDFYLPNGKVYIEYWGLEDIPAYSERKKEKIKLYKKYNLNLLELSDKDIYNLDDHLPRKLLMYGIKVF
jgi:hypothetical protein